MLQRLGNIFRVPDLRNKVLFTIAIICLYQAGANIPIPGVAWSQVQALQAKADLYAKSMGYRVARVVTFSESGGYAPQPPMPMMASFRSKEADSTPVEGGEMKVRIDVSATFELVK